MAPFCTVSKIGEVSPLNTPALKLSCENVSRSPHALAASVASNAEQTEQTMSSERVTERIYHAIGKSLIWALAPDAIVTRSPRVHAERCK